MYVSTVQAFTRVILRGEEALYMITRKSNEGSNPFTYNLHTDSGLTIARNPKKNGYSSHNLQSATI